MYHNMSVSPMHALQGSTPAGSVCVCVRVCVCLCTCKLSVKAQELHT